MQVSADKRLKKAALDNALMALADPSKAAKVDPVSEAFAQHWKQKAIDTEKNKNKVCLLCCSRLSSLQSFLLVVACFVFRPWLLAWHRPFSARCLGRFLLNMSRDVSVHFWRLSLQVSLAHAFVCARRSML